jgi:dipeptidyl aminopeptidase/acylaminoacyl peptidase
VAGLIGFDAAGGVFAWRPALSRRTQMAWKDRHGTVLQEVPVTEALHGTPSRDGRLIMLPRPDHQMNTVGFVVFDTTTGTTMPFTAPDTTSTSPVWSPDNRRAVYSLLRDGSYDLYIREVKPGGSEQRLLHTEGMKAAQSWSSDGKVILFNASSARTGLDLWAIDARRDATPRLFAGGEADQCCGRFSPDDAWIAYTSNESGRPEVFVRPSSGDAEPIRVSKAGGGAPEWHTRGHELYFLGPDNQLMSAAVSMTAGKLTAATPVPLFRINSQLRPAVRNRVSSDTPYATVGDRFLVAENEADVGISTINLLLNWTTPPGR